VVTIPLAGWNVYTVVGKAGCGKSVLGSFIDEQFYYFTSLSYSHPIQLCRNKLFTFPARPNPTYSDVDCKKFIQ
jgi:ABC-type uncharacterized transport system YnjBCD ATPase subunit